MLLELNQVGKREMLLNILSRVDAKNTPITKMAMAGEPITNTLCEWQADTFEDPNQDMIWEDGQDADSFSNASPDRARLRSYIAKLFDSAMVSDLAENVSDVAGVEQGSELAESIMKKIVRLGRAIEALIGSDLDTQVASGGVPYRFRGLGSWINNSAQATYPVPAAFLTPAASIDSTAVGSLTEALVNGVLQSIWSQTGQVDDMQLPCGPTLRSRFSTFVTRIDSATAGTVPVVRSYTNTFTGVIDNVVTQFKGDFGNVNIIPTLFNAHVNFGGSAAAAARRGYVFPTRLVKKSIKRKPRVRQLEDKGGGPRFAVDWVGLVRCENPLGCGAFKATT